MNKLLIDLEQELNNQFPKGECKERGNAMVLFAMFQIKLDEAVKELKDLLKEYKFGFDRFENQAIKYDLWKEINKILGDEK